MQEDLTLLAEMPVFGGLAPVTLESVVQSCEHVHVRQGEAFFREGDHSQSMYVLTRGRVGIYKRWRGSARLLRRLAAGDCFGEMALIDLLPRSASVIALDDCEALQITAGMLHEIYRHDPEQFTLLQMNMGREVSRRLRGCLDTLFRLQMGEPWPDEPVVQNPT